MIYLYFDPNMNLSIFVSLPFNFTVFRIY